MPRREYDPERARQHYLQNRETILARQKANHEKNRTDPEYVQRRREINRAHRARHPGRAATESTAHRNKHPLNSQIVSARHRSKKRGMPCTITVWDLELPATCPVLGIPLDYTYGKGDNMSPNRASLDRIDNTKGYVPGNVIVVSRRANALKNDATLAELESIVAFYRPLLARPQT